MHKIETMLGAVILAASILGGCTASGSVSSADTSNLGNQNNGAEHSPYFMHIFLSFVLIGIILSKRYIVFMHELWSLCGAQRNTAYNTLTRILN